MKKYLNIVVYWCKDKISELGVKEADKMEKNVGGKDKIVRIVGGIILIAISFVELEGSWQIILGVLGAYGLITGLTNRCPLCGIFHIKTANSS